MTPNLGGWIHNFAVTDAQTHKGGYTIYKITSIVFPRSVPQALTCLTIWKRFHDVKRLHRELSRRHKSMKLPGQLPEPTDCSFFKRFDADVIQRRRVYILQLLDFAAQHPVLYKCHAFGQFFSEAQQSSGFTPAATPSPLQKLPAMLVETYDADYACLKGTGAIAEICDKLDLLYDPHDDGISLLDPERDKQLKEKEANNDVASETGAVDRNGSFISVHALQEKQQPANEENEQKMQERAGKRPCKDYTRFLTPMASIESDDSDYIYEAALEFSRAVQAEANLEYKEAHVRYKRGVEVLLNGSKDDSNDERKFIAKGKISKYLARADDIFDKFLSENSPDGILSSKSNFQLSIDITDDCTNGDSTPISLYLERPWNHLAKYKVLQVLGERVMQVQCITEPEPRPTYVMKGIEKPSSNTPTQTVFLPQHVPYMIDLLAFFQSEQKIFLVLKQAEGGRLYDYIQTYKPRALKTKNFANLFPEVNEVGGAKEAEISNKASIISTHECIDSANANEKSSHLTPSESTELSELVRCSKQLLQSVSNTLKEVQQLEELPPMKKASIELLPIQKACELSTTQSKSPQKTVTNSKIPEASLKKWAQELAVAIHSLHGKGVILSDLHMENLLFGAKGQLLLSYFYQNEGFTSDNCVHKAYSSIALAGHFVAPERPLTFKSDWWSFGVVLYQLLLGLPFKCTHPGHIDLYGCVQYPENIEISENARDLLDNLLQQTPEERLDYEQIQAHAFFMGTNWGEVRHNGMNNSTTNCCAATNTGILNNI